MSQATITAVEGKKFSHFINHEGHNIGLIFPEIDEAKGTTLLVELPRHSRDIRNIEDAQIFIDMALNGDWDAVSDGLIPSPIP
jgi:hypothetical protein